MPATHGSGWVASMPRGGFLNRRWRESDVNRNVRMSFDLPSPVKRLPCQPPPNPPGSFTKGNVEPLNHFKYKLYDRIFANRASLGSRDWDVLFLKHSPFVGLISSQRRSRSSIPGCFTFVPSASVHVPCWWRALMIQLRSPHRKRNLELFSLVTFGNAHESPKKIVKQSECGTGAF